MKSAFGTYFFSIPFSIYSIFLFQFTGLSISLPKYVHLLTLEPWKSGGVLIRFEHILEKNEDTEYSLPVTFNLQDVFRSFDLISIRETTLAANQWLEKAERLKFIAEANNQSATFEAEYPGGEDDQGTPTVDSKSEGALSEKFTITLNPMEIRTFVVKMKWKA